MKCKLCGSGKIISAYQGLIRDGGLGKYTQSAATIWECEDCGVIWHDSVTDMKQYYESKEYRNGLEGSSDVETFYELHDRETFDKFQYTGTDNFRHKTIADIGCGAGAFLDFLSGVCECVIGVEPSAAYRQAMKEKGYYIYAYTGEARKDWENKVDIVTSFDVIEHVEDPRAFMEDIAGLLSGGGYSVIGTPTDAPIMRKLLGETYEKKLLFSTQHLWVFSENNLRMLAREAGFEHIEIKYFQRYGIGNLLGWLKEKAPRSEVREKIFEGTLNSVWKSECSEKGLADYIVLYAYKG